MTTTPFEERPGSTTPAENTDAQPGDGNSLAADGQMPATDDDREDLMPEQTVFRTPEVTETD